jgi:hypothetical protein
MAKQIDKADISKWIDGYVKAWKTNNVEEIGKLFTEDAYYSTARSTCHGSGDK